VPKAKAFSRILTESNRGGVKPPPRSVPVGVVQVLFEPSPVIESACRPASFTMYKASMSKLKTRGKHGGNTRKTDKSRTLARQKGHTGHKSSHPARNTRREKGGKEARGDATRGEQKRHPRGPRGQSGPNAAEVSRSQHAGRFGSTPEKVQDAKATAARPLAGDAR